jgi:hypothetical protein
MEKRLGHAAFLARAGEANLQCFEVILKKND